MRLSVVHQTFFWGAWILCNVVILSERANWKFLFIWSKINCHVLQIAKAHFRCTIWFMISEKKFTRSTLLHLGGALMHQKSQQTRHTKNLCTRTSGIYEHVYTYRRKEFQNISKENYTVALDSCYLFTKRMLNIWLNMILLVIIRFVYSRYSWALQQILWIPCKLTRW